MLLNISIGSLVPEAPYLASFGLNAPAGIGGAFGARGALTHRRPIALDLAAVAIHADAVGVFILHSEIVPDLAGPASQLLPAAHAPALDGVGSDDPVADIEVVDVLFANMVAAEPDVVVPVANLAFEVGAAHVAAMPDRAAVNPIGAQGNDVADRAVLNAFDGLDVTGLMAALGAGGYLEALLLGHFCRRVHHLAAGAVHRHWLFHEYMLAGCDGGLEMGGSKPRGRGQNGVIDTGYVQGLLVGVETAKALIRRHAEVFHALLGGFREYVSHRQNLGINPRCFCRIEEVLARAAAASAHADDDRIDGLCALTAENRWEARRSRR